jgi:hypothetical protein
VLIERPSDFAEMVKPMNTWSGHSKSPGQAEGASEMIEQKRQAEARKFGKGK